MSDDSFNTDEPIAYFITWTTYGTWLPGDQRGWNRKHQGDIKRPNPALEKSARAKMTEPELRLSPKHRAIVENTIRKHCEIRGWHPHVVNPRTNHVHVVVTAPGYNAKTVRDQFKAWCTRKLKESGLTRKNIWTEGGSKKSINTEDDLARVIDYASEAQDRKYLDEE